MGKKDNRRTRLVKRRKAQTKKKLREARKVLAGKATATAARPTAKK